MQVREEFTQNSKSQQFSKSNLWEEPLPLPSLEEVSSQTIDKQELPPSQVVHPKPKILFKKWFFLKARLTQVLVIFLFLAIGSLSLLFFFKPLRKSEKVRVPQVTPAVKIQPQVLTKRISSAFVPQSPSTQPANLSIYWESFKDQRLGIIFSYPAEWQIVPGNDLVIFSLYYPTVDSDENFGQTFLAKLSILKFPESVTDLAEILTKRYNLSETDLQLEKFGENLAYTYQFGNTFIFAPKLENQTFVLEGKVAQASELENFLPIFLNLAQSFKLLE